jgi:hypothetical protein
MCHFVEAALLRVTFLADVRHTFNETMRFLHQREPSRTDPIGEGADGAVFQMSDEPAVKIGDTDS